MLRHSVSLSKTGRQWNSAVLQIKRYGRCDCSLSVRRSAAFLFGRPFGSGERLESLVRNRLAALDRTAIGPGRKAGLGPLDGSELLAQIVCQTLVELVLVEVRGEVGRIFLVRRLAGVLVPEVRERPLDPLALSGQQLASPLRIHDATLPAGRRLS